MRKRLKKQYNTGGNTGIGADLGAGLLQGIGMGSQFGLPGALLGGVAGTVLGANQGIINRNNMLGYEDERKLREEKIAADEARLAAAQNKAILEQYPVEGTTTPRFTTGGDTEPVERTHTLADLPPGVLQFVLDSPRLMDAAATLDNDQMQRLINQAGQAHDDLEGKTDMEKLSYFKDMDMSWIKPLREKAGLSKADIVNEAVDGGLIKKAMKYPVLGASMLKNFGIGGQTLGPQYEAEGGEMIQYKDGEKPRVYGKGGLSQKASNEFEIKGPSHANGGVDMSDEKGARIYSDKLKVDSALAAKLMKL